MAIYCSICILIFWNNAFILYERLSNIWMIKYNLHKLDWNKLLNSEIDNNVKEKYINREWIWFKIPK